MAGPPKYVLPVQEDNSWFVEIIAFSNHRSGLAHGNATKLFFSDIFLLHDTITTRDQQFNPFIQDRISMLQKQAADEVFPT